MGKPMPPHKVVMRARLRNARITEDAQMAIRVEGTPLWVNRGLGLWREYLHGVSLVGRRVDVQVRHLILDPGTDQERQVWDARVLGTVK